ncbi:MULTISPECIES: hypothetical protein [unclassified Paenibacillus]|uniref:hypothetical protein n=1 Tax=unclassified Paenibacillus TaxID=185978 RepID=UPI003628B787
MKHKKIKKVLLGSVAVLLLITLVVLVVLDQSVNYILKSISPRIGIETKNIGTEQQGTNLSIQSENQQINDKPTKAQSQQQTNIPQDATTNTNQSLSPRVETKQKVAGSLKTSLEENVDKAKINGEKGIEGTDQKEEYISDISLQKTKEAQESMSVKEKAVVISVLLKKLSAEDINYFMKISADGITDDEKGEAKKLFLKKLTENEYNQLISIAAKYGLSQGERYKDSK